MAYLSDTDLATLHRMRLDEKNYYKLSLWNQNMMDVHGHHQYTTSISNNVKYQQPNSYNFNNNASDNYTNNKKYLQKEQNSWKKPINERVPSVDSIKSESSCSSGSSSVGKSTDTSSRLDRDFICDEEYFASSKSSRKRSGTWP